MTQGFFTNVFDKFGQVGRTAWCLLTLMGLATAALELARWKMGPNFTIVDYLGTLFLVFLWLATVYAASMSKISKDLEIRGFLSFGAASLIMILPILIGLGAILTLLSKSNQGLILTFSICLLLVGWVMLTILPALPVAQALSSKPVSPMTVLTATAGHRGALILISFAVGSVNKIVPATSDARSTGEALLLALGNGLVAIISTLLVANIGVTAWQYACKNNASLNPIQTPDNWTDTPPNVVK